MLLILTFLIVAVSSAPFDEFNDNQNSIVAEKNCYDKSICLTAGCLRAAVRMIDSIDETINPCDDFYNFACGKFKENTPLPRDKTDLDTFSITRDLVNFQLKKVLSKPSSDDEPKPFILARDFYQSCVNLPLIEKRGLQPITEILDSYAGWPAVQGNSWFEGSFDWIDALKRFRLMGLDHSIVFTVDVLPDAKDSTKRVIVIDQPSFGLESEFLVKGFDEKFVKAYLNFMIENAVLLGANKERAEQELQDALEFEIKLARISLSTQQRTKASTFYTTIGEIQTIYPYLNWFDYINALMPEGIFVGEDELVVDYVPSFFKQLGAVLASTPKRAIANYFMWRVLLQICGNGPENMRDLKLNYYKKVYGLLEKPDRVKECVAYTVQNLEIAVGSLYVRKYFKPEKKEAASEMVDNIRGQFIDTLQRVPWMDEETRFAAIEKAASIKKHIAYPNELLQDEIVSDYYKELYILPDNLPLNPLLVKKFETDKKFGQLREPIDKDDWRTHSKSATVGGFYSRVENSIQLTAGILQDRFFDLERPMYINYGAIGQVIGHEITHGFDNKGRLYDVNGNLRKWWKQPSIDEFTLQSQCFIEQYNNTIEPQTGLMLNGPNTLGENIADSGGLKSAYYAYSKWTELNGPEDVFPALEWNPKQLFWISSAQLWCSLETDEYLKNRITTGIHSPNQFRTNNVISNLFEFSHDFQCSDNMNMYPKQQCKIW